MHTFIKRLIAGCALIVMVSAAQAQVVIYREYTINDVPAFIGAVTGFYNALTEVEKPAAYLDVNMFDGDSPASHTLIEEFPDYANLEAFRNRIAESQGVFLQFLSSLNAAATFLNVGLAVELGFWGNREANREYYAVIAVNTTDAQSYVQAFERFAESVIRQSPGSIGLYQNRAGWQGATHFVVYWAPTFTALNAFADELTPQKNAAFAAFIDAISGITTPPVRTQKQNIMRWGM